MRCFFYNSPFRPIRPSKIKNGRAVVFQVFFYVFNCFFFNFSRWRPNRPIHPRKIIKFIFVIGIDRLHSCAQACWFVNISLLNLWMHSSQMAIPSNTSLEKAVVFFFSCWLLFRYFFIYYFLALVTNGHSVQYVPRKLLFWRFHIFFNFLLLVWHFFRMSRLICSILIRALFCFSYFLPTSERICPMTPELKTVTPLSIFLFFDLHFLYFLISYSALFWGCLS